MKCKATTKQGNQCSYDAVLRGLCMNHYIRGVKDEHEKVC